MMCSSLESRSLVSIDTSRAPVNRFHSFVWITFAGAAALAQYVIGKFPNGANIVFITGKPGGSAAIDRAQGVHDTIKAAGEKYKIEAEQTCNRAISESLTVTQNVLTSFGYMQVVSIVAK